jgi:hypothetical protein
VKTSIKSLIAIVLAIVSPIIPALMLLGGMANPARVSDLPEYYSAVELIKNGLGSQIYVWEKIAPLEHLQFPGMGERMVGLFVPPPAVPLLMPLAWIPLAQALLVWTFILLLALLASIFVLRQLFALSLTETLMVWSVLSISGPAYEALRIGQLAPILLLGFSLACLLLRRGATSVAAIPLSVLFLKPQELLPFVVFMIGAGKYKPVAVLIAIAGLLTVAAFGLIGMEGFHNYSQLMSFSMLHTQGMQPELSATLRGQLLRFWPDAHAIVTPLSTAVLLVSLLLILFLGWRFRGKQDWLTAALIGAMPLGLLTSLHCHDYDLILLAPSLLALMKSSAARYIPAWLKLAGILAAPLFLLPAYIFVHYHGLLNGGMLVNPLFVVLLIFSVVSFWSALQLHKHDEVNT